MANSLYNLSLSGLLLLAANQLSANDESVTNTGSDEDTYYEEFSEFGDEDYEGDDSVEWDISLGLAYSVSQTPYVAGKQESELMHYFSIGWGPLYFDGETLGSYLYGKDNWGISVSISRGMLNDSGRGDSADLSDMTPLSEVVMTSISFEIEEEWGALEASIAGDVSDKHNGITTSVTYGYPVYLEQWSLMPTIGAYWFDEKIAQYYYGVNAENTNATRALYTPSSGFNYSVGLGAEYDVNDNNSLSFSLLTQIYSDDIRQSSIVNKSHVTSLAMAYSYLF